MNTKFINNGLTIKIRAFNNIKVGIFIFIFLKYIKKFIK